MNKVMQGDCIELMRDLDDLSVDMILCDLPYGTTRCKWDTIIPLNELWEQYKRVIKPYGAIVLTANQPFTSVLVSSNLEWFKYTWTWIKDFPTGFLNANYRPMLQTEDICVFSEGSAGAGSKNKANKMPYFPQGLILSEKKKKNRPNSRGKHIHETVNVGKGNVLNTESEYVQKYTSYPSNVLMYGRDPLQTHPAQKPVKLFEYLIRTYSREDDTVLDTCAGSGTTAIACMNTNRQYIVMEKDVNYYNGIQDRIKERNEQECQKICFEDRSEEATIDGLFWARRMEREVEVYDD